MSTTLLFLGRHQPSSLFLTNQRCQRQYNCPSHYPQKISDSQLFTLNFAKYYHLLKNYNHISKIVQKINIFIKKIRINNSPMQNLEYYVLKKKSIFVVLVKGLNPTAVIITYKYCHNQLNPPKERLSV